MEYQDREFVDCLLKILRGSERLNIMRCPAKSRTSDYSGFAESFKIRLLWIGAMDIY